MNHKLLALVYTLCLAVGCQGQENTNSDFRYWTGSNGKRSSVRLKLISKDTQNVKLQREDDGREVSIPLDRLSKNDRQLVSAPGPKSGPASRLTATSSTAGDDWPYFRGPNRNGISNAKLELLDEPKEIWKFDSLGEGRHGSAVVANGKVFINGGWVDGGPSLYCLDADTGNLDWKSKSGNTHSTPAVKDGRVYAVDDNQFARCYDARTGDLIWESEKLPKSSGDRHYGHAGSPLIYGDLLIANFGGGVALRLSDGKEVWRHEGYPGLATPVVFSHKGAPAIAIFCGDKLVAREPQTGNLLWSIDREANLGVNACDPIFIDNDTKVFVSSSYAKNRAMYDISGAEPTEIWSMGSGSSYPSGVFDDGKLYGMAGGFGQINLETGARETRGPSANSVLVIDGKWVFLGKGGKLEIGTIDAGEFTAQMETQVLGEQTWNAPAYWKGKLYIRNQKGSLVCLQVGK